MSEWADGRHAPLGDDIPPPPAGRQRRILQRLLAPHAQLVEDGHTVGVQGHWAGGCRGGGHERLGAREHDERDGPVCERQRQCQRRQRRAEDYHRERPLLLLLLRRLVGHCFGDSWISVAVGSELDRSVRTRRRWLWRGRAVRWIAREYEPLT